MCDAEQLLAPAVEQIEVAASQLKQKHAMEAKMWHRKAQELQADVKSLQSQLHEAQKENAELRLALDEKTNEIERFRTMNSSLTRSLQEKEQEIAKYVSLSQSLKGLLDGQPEAPPMPTSESSQYETPVRKRATERTKFQSFRAPSTDERPPSLSPSTRATSQGSIFIKAAKSELTFSDFNQMISEINMYNKHQQTREETIANVKRLLCPAHRALFEQFLPMIGGD
jgi:uncharacterized protein YhaN